MKRLVLPLTLAVFSNIVAFSAEVPKIDPSIRNRIQSEGMVRVMVSLNATIESGRKLTPEEKSAKAETIRIVQDAVLNELGRDELQTSSPVYNCTGPFNGDAARRRFSPWGEQSKERWRTPTAASASPPSGAKY